LEAQLRALSLETGDQIRLIDQDGERILLTAPGNGDWETNIPVEKPGYLRLEVWRGFFPGLPMLPALVTNPIWFE
jgi:hypothetical protein